MLKIRLFVTQEGKADCIQGEHGDRRRVQSNGALQGQRPGSTVTPTRTSGDF